MSGERAFRFPDFVLLYFITFSTAFREPGQGELTSSKKHAKNEHMKNSNEQTCSSFITNAHNAIRGSLRDFHFVCFFVFLSVLDLCRYLIFDVRQVGLRPGAKDRAHGVRDWGSRFQSRRADPCGVQGILRAPAFAAELLETLRVHKTCHLTCLVPPFYYRGGPFWGTLGNHGSGTPWEQQKGHLGLQNRISIHVEEISGQLENLG